MAPLPQACSGHVGACQSPENNWTWTPHRRLLFGIPFYPLCYDKAWWLEIAIKQPGNEQPSSQDRNQWKHKKKNKNTFGSASTKAFPLTGQSPCQDWPSHSLDQPVHDSLPPFKTSKSYLLGNTLLTHFQTWLTKGLEADSAPVRNIKGLQLDPLEDLKYPRFWVIRNAHLQPCLAKPFALETMARKIVVMSCQRSNAFLPPLSTLSSWPGPGPQVEFCGIPCTWCFAEINQSIKEPYVQRPRPSGSLWSHNSEASTGILPCIPSSAWPTSEVNMSLDLSLIQLSSKLHWQLGLPKAGTHSVGPWELRQLIFIPENDSRLCQGQNIGGKACGTGMWPGSVEFICVKTQNVDTPRINGLCPT